MSGLRYFCCYGLLTIFAVPNSADAQDHNEKRSFEEVVQLKFDENDQSKFLEFAHWTANKSAEELRKWRKQITLSNGARQWIDFGCDEPESRGTARAMAVVVTGASSKAEADDFWEQILAAEKEIIAAVQAASKKYDSPKINSTELGVELARRVAIDQAWRASQISNNKNAIVREALSWKTWERTCRLDWDNVQFIKNMIAKNDWPTISKNGEKMSSDAFMLVQHADNDPEFQLDILKKMEGLLSSQDVSGKSYAMLYDRVALAQQRPQRYGTQFGPGNDGLCIAVRPVENPDKIDERRVAVGLSLLKDYAAKLEKVFGYKSCKDIFDTGDPLLPKAEQAG